LAGNGALAGTEQSLPQTPVPPLDRIALTIGVTGHRTVPPSLDSELRSEFAALLTRLAQAHPNTPLVVLSTLAAGTETLAVEVAHSLGIPVVACLPAPAEECQRDLAMPEDRTRFLAALAMCGRVDVVPSVARASRDFEAGAYVAHFSHIVVAFWDGKPETPGDPTAAVVKVRLSGTAGVETALASLPGVPDVGPVYRIVLPSDDAAEPAAPISVLELFPERFSGDANFERDFLQSLARIDLYNCDLPVAGPSDTAHTIATLRDRTDAVANQLQTTTFRFLYVLYAIAIIATSAQYTTSQVFKYAMFPIAFAFYRVAKRFDYENRYQDYRALSEGLRVQNAWFDAGLHDEQADQCYLGMQEKELQWIRMALRYAYFAFRDSSRDGRITSPGTRDWIDSQWSYFQTKPRREELWLRRLKRAVRVTFWLAAGVSVTLFALLYLPTAPGMIAAGEAALSRHSNVSAGIVAWLRSSSQFLFGVQAGWTASLTGSGWNARLHEWDVGSTLHGTKPHHAWLVQLSTGVLTLYAAVALLISNYCDKRGFVQNIKRYDRMFIVFDRAKRRLAAMPDQNTEPGRDVVRDLGRAALIENADWLLTRREHPMSFVT
jgi:hypothetical protein